MWNSRVMMLPILLAATPYACRQARAEGRQAVDSLLMRSVSHSSSPASVNSAFQEVMLGSGVPGGETIMQGCEEETQSAVRLRGTTLRDVLGSIVEADPHYRWEVSDGVVDLLPVEGVPSLLKTWIKTFDSADATDIASAGTFLFALPEIRGGAAKLGIAHNATGSGPYSLVPGPAPPKKPLGVHLHDATALDALNAIVRANKHGVWIYREIRCGSTQTFDISFTQ